jgi:hypothetical protein
VTQLTNFQARDFQVAISQAASAASSANQTFESMTATLGMMRNANMHASVAATAYRNAMVKLSADKKSWKKLGEYGIEVMNEETGKLKDLGKIMGELAPKLEGLDDKEKGLAIRRIFGIRGMKVYSTFVSQYHKQLKEGKVAVGDYAGVHRNLVTELNSATGAAASNRDALLKTAEGQRILLKGSWETTQIMMGKLAVPVVLPALKALTDTLNVFIQIIDKIPGPVRHFMATLLGVHLALKLVRGAFMMMRGMGAMAMMSNLANSVRGVGDQATGTAAKVTMLGRVTRRFNQQQLMQAKAFIGSMAGVAGAVIPILFAVSSYLEQKRQEEKKRQNEARQNAERSERAYGAALQVAKALRMETSRALAEEVKSGAKTAEKAELIYHKLLIKGSAQRQLVHDQHKAYLHLVRNHAKQKDIDAARAKWIKSSAKYEAQQRAMRDAEANYAKFQIKTAKTVAEKQLYGRRIVTQRTMKYEDMRRKYLETNKARRMAIAKIEVGSERKAAMRRFKWQKARNLESMRRYRGQTARMAARWGLADKDILRRKGQAAKLRLIAKSGREQLDAPTHDFMRKGIDTRDWAYAAKAGRLPRGAMTKDDLRQYMRYQQYFRSGHGMGEADLKGKYQKALSMYEGRGEDWQAAPGGMAGGEGYLTPSAPRPIMAQGAAGMENFADLGATAKKAMDVAMAAQKKQHVVQVVIDGKAIAKVVTSYQEGSSNDNDGTGAVTATTGVQGGG